MSRRFSSVIGRARSLALLALLVAAPAGSAQVPGWSGIARASGAAPLGLFHELRVNERMVHRLYLGVLPGAHALRQVRKVTYTLLRERLENPGAWAAGAGDVMGTNSIFQGHEPREDDEHDHAHEGREAIDVTVPGMDAGGPGFLLVKKLNWIPRQVLAVAEVMVSGHLTEVRLPPLDLAPPEPSMAIVLEPRYETRMTVTEDGDLVDWPQLTEIALRFRRRAERPDAADRIRRIGVGVGRSGLHDELVTRFEFFTPQDVRDMGGTLRLGSIASRRGLPTNGVPERADFLWVVLVDEAGRAESHATWRPIVLPPDLPDAEEGAARRRELLTPWALAVREVAR